MSSEEPSSPEKKSPEKKSPEKKLAEKKLAEKKLAEKNTDHSQNPSSDTALKKPKGSPKARRTAARLAAVQVLYELEMGDGATARQAVYDMMVMRQDEIDDVLLEPDKTLLDQIIIGLAGRLKDVDTLLEGAFGTTGRSLAQSEVILRCILRAGAFELLADGETPAGVIINDYINVAHAFFDGAEPKKVNGVLDKVAKTLDRT